MKTLRIEILNPKALQVIKGMQEQNLIRVDNEPVSKLKAFLKKQRRNSSHAPNLKEINKIVEKVRASRYAQK